MRLERLSKHSFRLLRGGRGIMDGGRTRQDHWAGISTNWDKVLAHEFDEVGWEESNSASITPQATHPPLSRLLHSSIR